jgi:hypothetical protein
MAIPSRIESSQFENQENLPAKFGWCLILMWPYSETNAAAAMLRRGLMMRNRRRSSTRWIVSEFDLTRLDEFNGRDRPSPLVASDRDSEAVHFVKPNGLHRTGLSIRENYGLPDKLGLGLLELAEDRGRTKLYSWHG